MLIGTAQEKASEWRSSITSILCCEALDKGFAAAGMPAAERSAIASVWLRCQAFRALVPASRPRPSPRPTSGQLRFLCFRLTKKVLDRLQPWIESGIPMRRIGRPGELKAVAVFRQHPHPPISRARRLWSMAEATAV